MIVLRNSSYSKKESVKLKDIPYGVRGLTAKSILLPSIAELTGRRRGMEVADKMDSQGKSDIEILDRSSKEAKKMGRVVGTATGLGVGVTGAHITKVLYNNLKKSLRNKDELKLKIDALKGLSQEEGFSGKFMKKITDEGENYLKDHRKTLNRIERKRKIIGGALIGAGVLGGMLVGGRRAGRASELGNLERMKERNKRNNNNK